MIEKILANIERQLYKYYDIDINLYSIGTTDVTSLNEYEVAGCYEDGHPHYFYIKCRIKPDCSIEDFRLNRDGEFIPPTTTEEQQYTR